MNRRIRKAERILQDLPRDADLGEMLEVARHMVDETETYPIDDRIVDLEKFSDDDYNEVLDAHEGLEKALNRWAEITERLGE